MLRPVPDIVRGRRRRIYGIGRRLRGWLESRRLLKFAACRKL